MLKVNKRKTAYRIAELIEKSRLSVLQISEEMGICDKTIYCWTSGRNFPTLDNLLVLAKLLDCKIDDLFVIEESEEII